MSHLPTIVIPYFKSRYLAASLASLASQTRQGFKVFIGDDASPEAPSAILKKYESILDIRYRRFDENLGRISLVKHWDRCVRETDSEWVWLFSDDDVAAPDCVESFLAAREKTNGQFNVYRFNTDMVDGSGDVIHHHPPHPEWEDVAEFALAKILSERFSFAVEYIFRRSAFDAAGGFVELPLAWFSDDASWILFGREAGLRTMECGQVFWRKSGVNLSSPRPELTGQKLDALRCYLLWLEKQFPGAAFQGRLKSGLMRKFPDQLQHWGGRPELKHGLMFWWFFVKFTGSANLLLLRTFFGATNLRGKLGLTARPQVCNTSIPGINGKAQLGTAPKR